MKTNYTPSQREAIAKAFRAAKPRLWDGVQPRGWWYTSQICFAVVEGLGGRGARHACEEVTRRLEGSVTMRMWLLEVARVPSGHLTPERVQAHRHAWLDRLIAEFEAPEEQP